MKKKAPILACALIFLLGMGIMFYPTVSNWVYEQTASYVISDYLEQTSTKTSEEAAELFAQASAYNETLTGDVKSFMIAEDNQENNELDEAYWNSFYDLNGIMGVIEIPSIDVSLPIYHGTDETTLVKGVGHLEGSALPTGEIGNHTVLTGHTGLPTAELFTDLDQLVIGDVFYVQILNKVFTYEVIEINVVLPSETEKLKAQEDKDLVTLVTCTPYGINSHRLLVTGEQIECTTQDIFTTVTLESNEETKTDALYNLPVLVGVAVVLFVIFGAAILFAVFLQRPVKKGGIDREETGKSPALGSQPAMQNKAEAKQPKAEKKPKEVKVSKVEKKSRAVKVPKAEKKPKVVKVSKIEKKSRAVKVPKAEKKPRVVKVSKIEKKSRVVKVSKIEKKPRVVRTSKVMQKPKTVRISKVVKKPKAVKTLKIVKKPTTLKNKVMLQEVINQQNPSKVHKSFISREKKKVILKRQKVDQDMVEISKPLQVVRKKQLTEKKKVKKLVPKISKNKSKGKKLILKKKNKN